MLWWNGGQSSFEGITDAVLLPRHRHSQELGQRECKPGSKESYTFPAR
jgi:hypothetical protein